MLTTTEQVVDTLERDEELLVHILKYADNTKILRIIQALANTSVESASDLASFTTAFGTSMMRGDIAMVNNFAGE